MILWAAGILLLYAIGGYFGVRTLQNYKVETEKFRQAWVESATTELDARAPEIKPVDVHVGISLNRISEIALGNRHLRRVIYLMTTSVVSQKAFFKVYFLKRKKEGLPPQKGIFATAHKLIRVIIAMLSKRTHFKVKEAI